MEKSRPLQNSIRHGRLKKSFWCPRRLKRASTHKPAAEPKARGSFLRETDRRSRFTSDLLAAECVQHGTPEASDEELRVCKSRRRHVKHKGRRLLF